MCKPWLSSFKLEIWQLTGIIFLISGRIIRFFRNLKEENSAKIDGKNCWAKVQINKLTSPCNPRANESSVLAIRTRASLRLCCKQTYVRSHYFLRGKFNLALGTRFPTGPWKWELRYRIVCHLHEMALFSHLLLLMERPSHRREFCLPAKWFAILIGWLSLQ